ncbi:MAG: hypothetical protein K5917_07950 [Clostridiales bacterium]|nr:hypothetical protein [Clostridiales bacterium]
MANTINDYMSYINNANGVNKSREANSTTQKNNSLISSEGFLQLLATQLTNQDCLNPTEDTQFIAQMAQFTSLQAMQEVSDSVRLQYGASLAGKTAYLSGMNSEGRSYEITGLIEAVNFSSDKTLIIINGSAYPITDLKEVLA